MEKQINPIEGFCGQIHEKRSEVLTNEVVFLLLCSPLLLSLNN